MTENPASRPSTTERYMVSVSSGDDWGIHLAAGMAGRHELGVALLRMRAEFDSIRGELRRLAAQGEMSEATALTERVEVLSRMKSLAGVKRVAMARAAVLATKKQFMQPDSDVAIILGRVLDVYLDQSCAKCSGTGTYGNAYAGDKPRKCHACNGTGHRRETMYREGPERAMAADLLADLEFAAAAASSAIKARLMQNDEAGKRFADAVDQVARDTA